MRTKTDLQILLCQRGISQAQIAKALGITPGQLSKKVRGHVPFLWREVVAICELTQVDNPLREIFPNK